jgi:hypothetical protein
MCGLSAAVILRYTMPVHWLWFFAAHTAHVSWRHAKRCEYCSGYSRRGRRTPSHGHLHLRCTCTTCETPPTRRSPVSMATELPPGVSWTQDDESIEVTVSVPSDATRADLRVQTTADNLSVHICSENKWRPIVTGTLRHSVERESCCWALEKQRKAAGGKALVIQLEKAAEGRWDALLRASTAGSILEELGRDQVIVDAGASTAESLVCGRCGALVKASRMEAHATMWCDALASDEPVPAARGESDNEASSDVQEPQRGAAAHLYWARSPTIPAGAPGSVQPCKLAEAAAEDGELV